MPFPKLTDEQIRHELANMLHKSKGETRAALEKAIEDIQSTDSQSTLAKDKAADAMQQIKAKIGELDGAYDQLFAFVNRMPSEG